jgi:hypothetical protein
MTVINLGKAAFDPPSDGATQTTAGSHRHFPSALWMRLRQGGTSDPLRRQFFTRLALLSIPVLPPPHPVTDAGTSAPRYGF